MVWFLAQAAGGTVIQFLIGMLWLDGLRWEGCGSDGGGVA